MLVIRTLISIGFIIINAADLITRDVHYDEANRYYKKDLIFQDFAYNEWHKEDDELFADCTDILDASEAIFDLKMIPEKGFEMYPYSDE